MDVYKGTGAFSGIAIGKILYYHKSEYQMRQYEITDVKTELNIFRQARTRVMEQLEDRLNYAKEIGGSYGGISDISRKADCAHQVFLSVKDDDDGKKELVEDGYLYYSDAEDSKNEIHNVLCKLGNYDAEIDLKSGSGNTAVLTVRIKRNDTVYYSEERTVALKNSSVTVITAADSSHVYSNTGTSTYLYIGSLE